jgi:hypothetical protein
MFPSSLIPWQLILLQGFCTAEPEQQLLLKHGKIHGLWHDALAATLKNAPLFRDRGLRRYRDYGN